MSSAVDKAVANLEDEDEDVRTAAVQALGKSPEAVARHGAAIAQRLEDEDANVRNAAVEALGESPEAVAQHGVAIAQRLEDERWDVRKAAVRALGKLSVKQCAHILPEIIKHTGHEDKDVASFTRRILVHVEPATLALRLHRPDGGETLFRPIGQMPEHAELLGRAVEADPSLAKLTDHDGRSYIEHACLECREAMQRVLAGGSPPGVDEAEAVIETAQCPLTE